MVGGEADAVERARPVLGDMGKAVIHAGASGAGQTAKVCNNLILAVSMIGVCEAFGMAGPARARAPDPLRHRLQGRTAGSAGRSPPTARCRGPVEAAPSNRDYAPGFHGGQMMLKDLRLAQACSGLGRRGLAPWARRRRRFTPLFCNAGNGADDFSGIMKMIGQGE